MIGNSNLQIDVKTTTKPTTVQPSYVNSNLSTNRFGSMLLKPNSQQRR